MEPGDTIPVTVMEDRPTQLRWRAERGALYTVMLMDAGMSSLWLYILTKIFPNKSFYRVVRLYTHSSSQIPDRF